MRNLFIIILLFPLIIQAQTFTHSVFAGINSSYFTSRDSEIQTTGNIFSSENLGMGIGYNFEYNFPGSFIIGTSIQYLSINSIFSSPCYCIHPHDRHVSYTNFVNTYNFAIPVYIKLKTNKKNYTYIDGVLGINWLFSSSREVNFVVSLLNQDEPIITEIKNGAFTLENTSNNQLGTFYQIGIGQIFSIKEIVFFTELSFRQDLNYWIYHTVKTNDGIKDYMLKRNGIIFKIGVFL
jgi:hypothetical protein